MSLKAKIEAVIYASEEPVTLAQLAALFAGEVLSARFDTIGEEDALLRNFPVESLIETGIIQAGGLGSVGFGPNVFANEPFIEAPQPEAPTEADEKRAARERDRNVREGLRQIVDELIADYAGGDRGMEIREIAGGYRIATKPEYHDVVRAFVKSLKPPMKLSLQALETLAVIAYKQPVTAPEVGEIRGVDSSGVLGSLMSRKLITTAGRKQVIGRPILYKTTKEFLLRFGLKDLNELPSIEEFEKLAGEIEVPEEDASVPDADLPFEESPAVAEERVAVASESDANGQVASTAVPLDGKLPETTASEEASHAVLGDDSDRSQKGE